jgi:hypothetical protein
MGCSQPEDPLGQEAGALDFYFPQAPQEETSPEDTDHPDSPDQTDPEDPQVVLTIRLAGDEGLDMPELPGEIFLSKAGSAGLPQELVIQVSGDIPLTCLVSGKKILPSEGEFVIRAADYGVRGYFITLVGIRDGVPYGREIPLTVTE